MNKVTTVVHKLLDLMGIAATTTTIDETLKSHPYFPSLLAVRDTLFSLRVANTSYNLERKHLSELPTPCIVHLKEGLKEEFTVIKSIDQHKVIHLKDNQEWINESLADFGNKWSGVVLLAEAQEASGEQDYIKSRLKEWLGMLRSPFLFATLGLILIGIFLQHLNANFPIKWWMLLVIHAIGMLVSLLLMTEYFNGYKYIKKICGNNTHLDCANVLKSSQAKLWGIISWSELAFVYYTGGCLLLGLNDQIEMQFNAFFLLSVLALPFTVYSIVYQFSIKKVFCPLCSLVIALVWTELYLLFPDPLNFHFDQIFIYKGLISFLVPISAWSFIKPWVEGLQTTRDQLVSAQKLKRNPFIFSKILKEQLQMPSIEEAEPLVLGNPDATHSITVVTNPFCAPCIELHKQIKEIIDCVPDVKCQLIFSVGDDNEKENHLLAQYFITNSSQNKGNSILESWYNQADFNFKNWHKSLAKELTPSDDSILILKKHVAWCKKAKIIGTPTIYINGYQLPSAYSLMDLKFLFSSF